MLGQLCMVGALVSLVISGETLMAQSDAGIVGLRCEYLTNPLGIDTPRPRLSWIIETDQRGWRQSAYHILVATRKERLAPGEADLWDSGRIESTQSIQIAYSGIPLASRMQCYWRVRVWNADGEASPWSDVSTWSMGLLKHEDWTAQWIGVDWFADNAGRLPWLRKTFTIDDKPRRAMAYVNAIGYYEFYINGHRIGEDVLSPLVSAYPKRSLYVTYDITDHLKQGRNCIAFWLGRGWESRLLREASDMGPVVRMQFDMERADGQTERVGTDEMWKVHPSPITPLGAGQAGDYGGEEYDARCEVPGWNTADFDDSQWKPARLCAPRTRRIAAQCAEPNRIFETISPTSVKHLDDGGLLVDMGRNYSGWLEIRFPAGESGQKIEMEYADKLFPDGKLQTYRQRDEYIMRGRGEEVFRNRFNYHAFRWVKITGLHEKLKPMSFKGRMIHTGYAPAAAFECSNDLLNRIYETTVWTYRCLSLGGYVVDCPTRERLGYGGDSGASFETGMMNFDLAALFTKWLADWQTDQAPDGDLPHTSPHPGDAGGGPAWGGIIVTLPWQVYVQYGDRRILEEMYPSMRKWIAFLETKVEDDLLQSYVGVGHSAAKWSFLGDWVPPGRGQGNNRVDDHSTLFFNNCYMLSNIRLVAETAAVLGRQDEARAYQKRAAEFAQIIHQRFLNDDGATYANGEQPYLAMPLLFGIVPEELYGRVMNHLEQDIRVTRKGHLNTGMHGTYYLLKLLINQGRNDLIYEMASKDTFPSWGHMLKNGATAIWEQWDGEHSQIHNTLISIGAWFIQGLGGIQYDVNSPGFKHFFIRPGIVTGLGYVRSEYRSMYGTIESHWTHEGDRLTLELVVPANTTATVIIPAGSLEGVTEGGHSLKQAEGIGEIRYEEGLSSFLIGAGEYKITSRLPSK